MRRKIKLTLLLWVFLGLLVLYFIHSLLFNSDSSSIHLNDQPIVLQYRDKKSNLLIKVQNSVNNSLRPVENEGFFKQTKLTPYNRTTEVNTTYRILRSRVDVVLAVVACGDRLHEALVMIKSAILFSSNVNLRVVVIADRPLMKAFEEKLEEWKILVNNSFAYEVHPVSFPENGKAEWRNLFKPCSSQRLFFPTLLQRFDSLLYVDSDTLFLGPLELIWEHFNRMNDLQMAGLAPESEDNNTGWYNRFARHPYYGKFGANSGVMLMNLTRMRQFGWEKYLSPIYKEFQLKITWGDQDIINIIFFYHPERVYDYSCRFNYRSDHCMYMSVCREAEAHGVVVIHGSRGSFHSDRQPAFKAIFSAFEEYQLGSDAYQNLLLPLENSLDATSHTNCGKVREVFTRNLHLHLAKEPFR